MRYLQDRMLALIAAYGDLETQIGDLKATASVLCQSTVPIEALATLGGLIQLIYPSQASIVTLANERAHFRANGKRNLKERHRQARKRADNTAKEPTAN